MMATDRSVVFCRSESRIKTSKDSLLPHRSVRLRRGALVPVAVLDRRLDSDCLSFDLLLADPGRGGGVPINTTLIS